jgi:hypothetical protein
MRVVLVVVAVAGCGSMPPVQRGAPARFGAIHGVVRDATTHEALPGATVVVDGQSILVGDALGRFAIDGLAPGEHAVTYYYACARTDEVVHVTAGRAAIGTGEVDRRSACPVVAWPKPACACGPDADDCVPAACETTSPR